MSFSDCAYVDGTGGNFVSRSEELNNAGFDIGILCDSDVPEINAGKMTLRESGIDIFDCEPDISIEQQIFDNIPWDGVKKLIDYAKKSHYRCESDMIDSVKARYPGRFPENWLNSDTNELRKAIGLTAKKKEWFKRIDHGEELGNVIFEYFDEIGTEKHLRQMLVDLSAWVDE
jgi:hypothetical protein